MSDSRIAVSCSPPKKFLAPNAKQQCFFLTPMSDATQLLVTADRRRMTAEPETRNHPLPLLPLSLTFDGLPTFGLFCAPCSLLRTLCPLLPFRHPPLDIFFGA